MEDLLVPARVTRRSTGLQVIQVIQVDLTIQSTHPSVLEWNRRRSSRLWIDSRILYDDCMEARGGKIESVSSKPKTNYRPQPLDTIKFEKLAVRKLKISAKKAMDIAERLYNRGYISYPRTETNKFASDIDLSSLVRQLATSPDWGDFASEVLEYGPNPRNGTKSDEAHPPIHPLKQVSGDSLQGDDRRVYDLIARHFLACVSWDAKGQETRVRMRIGGETFHASGLCVQDLGATFTMKTVLIYFCGQKFSDGICLPRTKLLTYNLDFQSCIFIVLDLNLNAALNICGYLKVYIYDKWSDKTLPTYVEGEELTDFQLRIADGQTQPPELLNEADLIALMDKYGIGTDATHAEHIEKIKTRMYVGVREDGRFIPGFLGLALVDGYDAMGREYDFIEKEVVIEITD
uniref:DNA topoisomerase n=1 Tax=Angiostrongylus cantonensis TaxID=6313 RepID=A0A0K0CVM7_ANGCA